MCSRKFEHVSRDRGNRKEPNGTIQDEKTMSEMNIILDNSRLKDTEEKVVKF